MLVPQGLAYALLAEVDVKFGLTSGILGVLLYSLFGSSSVLAVGPTAVVLVRSVCVEVYPFSLTPS